MKYPKWSEIAGLVGRLSKRKHPDCIAAAEMLEDLHSRLHNTTGELETTQDRIAKLGYMIEDAAAKAELQREGDTVRAFTIPAASWFKLLGYYRSQQEGQWLYQELKSLRELAGIAAETLKAVDNWLGHAGTREAAMDALWRLTRILERAGFPTPLEHLAWRGQLIRAMEEAGLGIGEDGAMRVRQAGDKYWEPASGPLIADVLSTISHAHPVANAPEHSRP